MPNLIDLTGKKFGRLTVLERDFKHVRGGECGGKKTWPTWKCECSCGKIVYPKGCKLKIGKVKSCGCLYKEERRYCHYKEDNVKDPLYNLWRNVKARTGIKTCKSYQRYGALGINMYKAWAKDFHLFRSYILMNIGPRPSKKHSIDRINNKLGYLPSNIRWATWKQQMQNRGKLTVRKCSSKYKGVQRVKSGNYQAYLAVDRHVKYLGTFPDEKDAARAYNKGAKKWFGDFAQLNRI